MTVQLNKLCRGQEEWFRTTATEFCYHGNKGTRTIGTRGTGSLGSAFCGSRSSISATRVSGNRAAVSRVSGNVVKDSRVSWNNGSVDRGHRSRGNISGSRICFRSGSRVFSHHSLLHSSPPLHPGLSP